MKEPYEWSGMSKKPYIAPELEWIELDPMDIITSSMFEKDWSEVYPLN